MLCCALVQQGHRKALALGGHLQEHRVDHDQMIHFHLDLLIFLVEVLYCVGVVLRL